MSSYCIKTYIDGFYTSRAFQGYQEHQNWSSNKEVMQVPKLEENQQTLQHLWQSYVDFFRQHMSSYFIKSYMDGFYTSRAFQQYQEHPNRSSYDKVMVLRSWSKNRGLQQPTSRRCRNRASRRRDVRGRFWGDF